MRDRQISILLRIAAAGVAIGLGVSALFYGLPLRTLFWDEGWWLWFANLAGFTWKGWVTSAVVDQYITLLGKSFGFILIMGGGLLAFMRKPRRVAWVIFFVLLLQHFLLWKDHFWNTGHLLELGLQTSAPLLLLWWTNLMAPERITSPETGNKASADFNRFWLVVRVLVAVTFVGHGLYAAGFHPVPANFIFMTQSGLGVGEPTARTLLQVVGVLDFLAAILLLLPFRRAQISALLWIIPWALLTTLARLWSYGGLVSAETLIWQWLPEVVRRLPHILVPVALWRALRAA